MTAHEESEQYTTHPIHLAAEGGRLAAVRAFLDRDADLVNRQDRFGGTPLHRAVIGRSQRVTTFLLDRGADLRGQYGAGRKAFTSYPPQYSEPIDLAIWGGRRYVRVPFWLNGLRFVRFCLTVRFRRAGPGPWPCDPDMARMLLGRGASYDLTIAAALGDLERVTTLLDQDPTRIQHTRPNLRRPLTAAVEFGHDAIVRLMLARGADPTWPDADDSPRGAALHCAARRGNRNIVELLLQHGADPNAHVDSAGNAVFASAKTPDVRALLESHGGRLDPYDLVWLDEDDNVVQRIAADPESAYAGCGGVYPAVVTRKKHELLRRLLDAGVRVPPAPCGCRNYLMEDPAMLKQLLERGGLHPDYPEADGSTLLHGLCGPDDWGTTKSYRIGCATILLDAGAALSPRNEQNLTPLAMATRNNLPDMVEFLTARGAS